MCSSDLAEMVRRIAEEVEGYVVELGLDGRLVELQLEELTGGVEEDRRLVCKDYLTDPDDAVVAVATTLLAELDDDDLLDLRCLTGILRLPTDVDLDAPLQPRGHRLLRHIPRLPEAVADHVVERFGSLARIMRAGLGELVEAEGVGEVRARSIKDGLQRVAETSILDRFV